MLRQFCMQSRQGWQPVAKHWARESYRGHVTARAAKRQEGWERITLGLSANNPGLSKGISTLPPAT